MQWILVLSLFTMQPDGHWKTERSIEGPFLTRAACVKAIEFEFNNGTQGIASCVPGRK